MKTPEKPKDGSGLINAGGFIVILLGFLLTIIGLYAKVTSSNLPIIYNVLIEFAINFGLALITLGLLGIIINLRDWKKYFQERLRDTILRKGYLSTLNKAELLDLQTSTLKAFFNNEQIDREGSFLNYFFSRIHTPEFNREVHHIV